MEEEADDPPLRRRQQHYRVSEFNDLLREMARERPILPFLVPIFLLAWIVERWVVPYSNWVPLCVTVWATVQYAKYRQNEVVQDINNRWKRHFFCSQMKTSPEPTEWLNKLLLHVWPNFIEKRLSSRFFRLVQRRVKEKRPKPIQSIEVHDFVLGNAPPQVGFNRTYWSTEGDTAVLHTGFEWVSNEMSVLLAANLGSPFTGKTARININSLRISGDLRLVPILDGQAILYAFETTPEVKLGVAFGSGKQHLPATELPVVSTWLERLLVDTLTRTMVEPRRRCFSLPVHDLKMHALGGVLAVSVLSAQDAGQKSGGNDLNGSSSSSSGKSGMFVELTIGDLPRKTGISDDSTWKETITMPFHGSAANLHLSLYEAKSNSVKFNFLGTCEIKFKYVSDGSTTFWAVGPNSSVVAARAEECGKEMQMTLPLEKADRGELTVKLVLMEWHFSSDSYNGAAAYLRSTSFPLWENAAFTTGRKIKVTVVEGRNLAPKDRSGKSDPYVKLQYGKTVRKTKIIRQDLSPRWDEAFEFDEYNDGEYLKIKCFDADILMNDENMGSARINLHSLKAGAAKDVWVPLEKIDRGEIHLVLEALDAPRPRPAKSSADDKTLLLEIVLVEAKELVAADWNGTSDPYVSVRYGSIKKRTKVIYKSLYPKWNEAVEFIDDGSPLELHVKDYNAIMPSSSIGRCELSYQRLPVNQTLDRWILLEGVSRGEIHIQLTRRELQKQQQPQALERQPSSRVEQVSKEMQEAVGSLYDSFTGDSDEGVISRESLEGLERAEEQQRSLMLQLHKEKELLLSKVKELQQAMDGLDLSRASSL